MTTTRVRDALPTVSEVARDVVRIHDAGERCGYCRADWCPLRHWAGEAAAELPPPRG